MNGFTQFEVNGNLIRAWIARPSLHVAIPHHVCCTLKRLRLLLLYCACFSIHCSDDESQSDHDDDDDCGDDGDGCEQGKICVLEGIVNRCIQSM